jgi:hypothetical protein
MLSKWLASKIVTINNVFNVVSKLKIKGKFNPDWDAIALKKGDAVEYSFIIKPNITVTALDLAMSTPAEKAAAQREIEQKLEKFEKLLYKAAKDVGLPFEEGEK